MSSDSNSGSSSSGSINGPDHELILHYLNDFGPHRYPTGAPLQIHNVQRAHHSSYTTRMRQSMPPPPQETYSSRATSLTASTVDESQYTSAPRQQIDHLQSPRLFSHERFIERPARRNLIPVPSYHQTLFIPRIRPRQQVEEDEQDRNIPATRPAPFRRTLSSQFDDSSIYYSAREPDSGSYQASMLSRDFFSATHSLIDDEEDDNTMSPAALFHAARAKLQQADSGSYQPSMLSRDIFSAPQSPIGDDVDNDAEAKKGMSPVEIFHAARAKWQQADSAVDVAPPVQADQALASTAPSYTGLTYQDVISGDKYKRAARLAARFGGEQDYELSPTRLGLNNNTTPASASDVLDNEQQPPLFRIAGELRNLVYELAMQNETTILLRVEEGERLGSHFFLPKDRKRVLRILPAMPPLHQVCRSMRDESPTYHYYAKNTFLFTDSVLSIRFLDSLVAIRGDVVKSMENVKVYMATQDIFGMPGMPAYHPDSLRIRFSITKQGNGVVGIQDLTSTTHTAQRIKVCFCEALRVVQ
ncbi:hypothetical protein LTS10_013045 [Elasticomyces elasticus]|nr:hypothetical protein LTS10_013045 [Elasticomyces elasticus]